MKGRHRKQPKAPALSSLTLHAFPSASAEDGARSCGYIRWSSHTASLMGTSQGGQIRLHSRDPSDLYQKPTWASRRAGVRGTADPDLHSLTEKDTRSPCKEATVMTQQSHLVPSLIWQQRQGRKAVDTEAPGAQAYEEWH